MRSSHWLFKSEPETFSIEDLEAAPAQTTLWDGVRNYQARNMLRDEIRPGDRVLFYHSSTKEPGVAGTARVVRSGYPDPSQFEARSEYFDPGSTREQPRWYAVDIRLDRIFGAPVSLAALRDTPGLEKMLLLRRGNRLSVMPVTPVEWRIVVKLGTAGASPRRKG